MSDDPILRVWITKYALTAGVTETDARQCVGINPDMISVGRGECHHKPDWHTSEEAAEARVRDMIEGRIKSLGKSLAKVEKLRDRPFSEFVKEPKS